MSSASRVSGYRLSPKALADLDEIWRYTAETWSIEQADQYIDALVSTFETIVSMPTLAWERSEFTPPVRIHIHEAQLIIYTINEGHIDILRLLGGRQDWRSILKSIDP